jgi:hypothetical protein
MIRNKILLMSILIGGMLMGMHTKRAFVLDKKDVLYLQIGEPFNNRSLGRTAYPVFVMSIKDDKKKSWFNFDRPVKTIEWHRIRQFTLCVTLDNNKTHELSLASLHN